MVEDLNQQMKKLHWLASSSEDAKPRCRTAHLNSANELPLLQQLTQLCQPESDVASMIRQIFQFVGAANKTFVQLGLRAWHEYDPAPLLTEGWHGFAFDSSGVAIDSYRSCYRKQLKDGVFSLAGR